MMKSNSRRSPHHQRRFNSTSGSANIHNQQVPNPIDSSSSISFTTTSTSSSNSSDHTAAVTVDWPKQLQSQIPLQTPVRYDLPNTLEPAVIRDTWRLITEDVQKELLLIHQNHILFELAHFLIFQWGKGLAGMDIDLSGCALDKKEQLILCFGLLQTRLSSLSLPDVITLFSQCFVDSILNQQPFVPLEMVIKDLCKSKLSGLFSFTENPVEIPPSTISDPSHNFTFSETLPPPPPRSSSSSTSTFQFPVHNQPQAQKPEQPSEANSTPNSMISISSTALSDVTCSSPNKLATTRIAVTEISAETITIDSTTGRPRSTRITQSAQGLSRMETLLDESTVSPQRLTISATLSQGPSLLASSGLRPTLRNTRKRSMNGETIVEQISPSTTAHNSLLLCSQLEQLLSHLSTEIACLDSNPDTDIGTGSGNRGERFCPCGCYAEEHDGKFCFYDVIDDAHQTEILTAIQSQLHSDPSLEPKSVSTSVQSNTTGDVESPSTTSPLRSTFAELGTDLPGLPPGMCDSKADAEAISDNTAVQEQQPNDQSAAGFQSAGDRRLVWFNDIDAKTAYNLALFSFVGVHMLFKRLAYVGRHLEKNSDPITVEKMLEIKSLTDTFGICSQKAEKLKLEGNSHFRLKEFQKAIEYYTEAIKISPSNDNNKAIFYCNRATCFVHTQRYESAIADCTTALQIDPLFMKPLYRRAQAFEQIGNIGSALQDLTKLLQTDQKNVDAVKSYARLVELQQSKIPKNMPPPSTLPSGKSQRDSNSSSQKAVTQISHEFTTPHVAAMHQRKDSTTGSSIQPVNSVPHIPPPTPAKSEPTEPKQPVSVAASSPRGSGASKNKASSSTTTTPSQQMTKSSSTVTSGADAQSISVSAPNGAATQQQKKSTKKHNSKTEKATPAPQTAQTTTHSGIQTNENQIETPSVNSTAELTSSPQSSPQSTTSPTEHESVPLPSSTVEVPDISATEPSHPNNKKGKQKSKQPKGQPPPQPQLQSPIEKPAENSATTSAMPSTKKTEKKKAPQEEKPPDLFTREQSVQQPKQQPKKQREKKSGSQRQEQESREEAGESGDADSSSTSSSAESKLNEELATTSHDNVAVTSGAEPLPTIASTSSISEDPIPPQQQQQPPNNGNKKKQKNKGAAPLPIPPITTTENCTVVHQPEVAAASPPGSSHKKAAKSPDLQNAKRDGQATQTTKKQKSSPTIPLAPVVVPPTPTEPVIPPRPPASKPAVKTTKPNNKSAQSQSKQQQQQTTQQQQQLNSSSNSSDRSLPAHLWSILNADQSSQESEPLLGSQASDSIMDDGQHVFLSKLGLSKRISSDEVSSPAASPMPSQMEPATVPIAPLYHHTDQLFEPQMLPPAAAHFLSFGVPPLQPPDVHYATSPTLFPNTTGDVSQPPVPWDMDMVWMQQPQQAAAGSDSLFMLNLHSSHFAPSSTTSIPATTSVFEWNRAAVHDPPLSWTTTQPQPPPPPPEQQNIALTNSPFGFFSNISIAPH